MPEYNNVPQLTGEVFDPATPVAEVMEQCGCDPSKYFEFEFFDTEVTQVTRADLTLAGATEGLLGQPITLRAFMVDISPSAICAEIVAGHFGIGAGLSGRLAKAVQSDLRLNIRTPGMPIGGQFSDETAGAWFETTLAVTQIAPAGSEVLAAWQQAGVQTLEVRFHLNRYTRLDNPDGPDEARLTGDVYGYVREPLTRDAADGTRLAARRIIAHPRLREAPELAAIFLADPRDLGNPDGQISRNTDIDGTYDLLPDERALVLRTLDFISFLDREGTTPAVAGYGVSLEIGGQSILVGEFRGDHEELARTGGLIALKLTAEVSELALAKLRVDVRLPDGAVYPLMGEPEWDFVLESPRGLSLASHESAEVVARVFRDNRPAAGMPVTLRTQAANRRSPIVGRLAGTSAVTSADGRVRARVDALDLENAPPTLDPVTGATLSGLLPWDRNYGNFVYLEIPNPERWTVPPVEVIELAVRVRHRVDLAALPAQPSFAQHVVPLFAYYLRYFPWLHTRRSGAGYARFLNLAERDEFAAAIDEIIDRLSLPEEDPGRMPRSRDFPAGGLETIERWRDGGMQA